MISKIFLYPAVGFLLAVSAFLGVNFDLSPEMFDVVALGFVIGSGLLGHFVGLVPQIVNTLVVFLVTAFSILIGSSIAILIIPLIPSFAGLIFFSLIFGVLILVDSTVKVLFVPKNLAKEMYIDVPLYYIGGAIVGSLNGIVLASLAYFCLAFCGITTKNNFAERSVASSLVGWGERVWRVFVMPAVKDRLFQSFETNGAVITSDGVISSEGQNGGGKPTQIEMERIELSVKIISATVGDEKITNVLKGMLLKLPQAEFIKLEKKLIFLNKRELLTKDATVGLVAHDYLLFIKQFGLQPDENEKDLITSFAIENLAKTTQDGIVQSYGKRPQKLKPVQHLGIVHTKSEPEDSEKKTTLPLVELEVKNSTDVAEDIVSEEKSKKERKTFSDKKKRHSKSVESNDLRTDT